MFGINLSEFFVIAVLALILIGPKQLPEVARTVARFLNELKRGTDVFAEELKAQVNDVREPKEVAKETTKDATKLGEPLAKDSHEKHS